MTNEEKELLLKDLCARLPYGITASVRGSDEEFQYFHIVGVKDGKVWVENDMLRVNDFDDVEVVKPYLRPMSSMTEEERYEMGVAIQEDYVSPYGEIKDEGEDNLLVCTITQGSNLMDWLNAHHFDYRYLIKKGLALEAPEGMY